MFVCVLTWSLLGVKKAWPLPDRSPLGLQFKISNEHPHPFHMRSSPAPLPPPGALASETVLILPYT